MRMYVTAVAASAALFTAAFAAYAASDYLLEIDGVKGEASAAPATIEVQSFSWGVSNPTSVGSSGMSAGKAAVQDLSRTVVSPRDSASGQASGRRMVTVDAGASGAANVALAPADAGQIRSFTAMVRESPTKASTGVARACATGQHISKATLRGPRQTVSLDDVVVSSCSVVGDMRKYELTGHVTLIK
jgi:type VI protein secretion system component Hcp